MRFEDLKLSEKEILCRIYRWDTTERGCFAKNQTIAEQLGLNDSTVSKSISKLSQKGYIHIEDGKGSKRKMRITEKCRRLISDTIATNSAKKKPKETETRASYDINEALENARKLDPNNTKRKR